MTMQTTALLMHNLLGRGARVGPNVEVVTKTATGAHRQSLAQTRDRACQLAHALAAEGIQSDEHVASFAWNNHHHLEMYQGVPSMGALLHTLNIRLSPGELEYIISHAEDQIIILDPDSLLVLMSAEQVTISAGVPTIWQGAMSALKEDPNRCDFSNLTRVTCGGSAPPPALMEWFWEELKCEMIQG